jgi:hypothetical protein
VDFNDGNWVWADNHSIRNVGDITQMARFGSLSMAKMALPSEVTPWTPTRIPPILGTDELPSHENDPPHEMNRYSWYNTYSHKQ